MDHWLVFTYIDSQVYTSKLLSTPVINELSNLWSHCIVDGCYHLSIILNHQKKPRKTNYINPMDVWETMLSSDMKEAPEGLNQISIECTDIYHSHF